MCVGVSLCLSVSLCVGVSLRVGVSLCVGVSLRVGVSLCGACYCVWVCHCVGHATVLEVCQCLRRVTVSAGTTASPGMWPTSAKVTDGSAVERLGSISGVCQDSGVSKVCLRRFSSVSPAFLGTSSERYMWFCQPISVCSVLTGVLC